MQKLPTQIDEVLAQLDVIIQDAIQEHHHTGYFVAITRHIPIINILIL